MIESVVWEAPTLCGAYVSRRSLDVKVCCAPGVRYTFPCGKSIPESGGFPSSRVASSPLMVKTSGVVVGASAGVGFAKRLIWSNALRVVVDFLSVVVVGFVRSESAEPRRSKVWDAPTHEVPEQPLGHI